MKRTVGPKGQVVIPKEMRDKLGLKEGSEVVVELRGEEIVIRPARPPVESYVDYYCATYSRKLREEVDLERVLEEEEVDRARLLGL